MWNLQIPTGSSSHPPQILRNHAHPQGSTQEKQAQSSVNQSSSFGTEDNLAQVCLQTQGTVDDIVTIVSDANRIRRVL